MHTRRIDAALDALTLCRERVPTLRDALRPGTPQRQVIETLIEALRQTEAVLETPNAAGRSST